jgi:diguanylate cyclase (GGDEF)-like protein
MIMLKEMKQAAASTDEMSHATLLIVDDYLDNVRSLSLLLRDSGYSVRKATSGEMALETIQIAKPDLVLLDVRMPEMDGYEVCEQLKANPETCDIPIIFLSASNDTDDKVQAFAVGGADYVTKPFQAEEVLARVRHQITILRQQQQLAAQNTQLQQIKTDLQRANLELQRIASTDGLTQIANRRCFDEVLEQEWKRLRRDQQPLSLILCDIDYFKHYNDRYGHLAGDACLRQVAQTISECVKRPADKVARYGGEEFAIILPNINQAEAATIARAVQARIHSLQIPHAGSASADHITLSFGIACLVPALDSSCHALIAAADGALYQAKAAGRNTWAISGQ